MNEQPDKLFRDKLYGFEKPASGGVWKRISELQNVNQTRFTWLKVAAAIALLAVAGVLIFNIDETRPQAIADNTPKNEQTNNAPHKGVPEKATSDSAVQESQGAPANKLAVVTERGTAKKTKQKRVKRETPAVALPTYAPPVVAAIETATPEIDAKTDKHDMTIEASAPHSQARKTVTIVFDATEVDEKYLTKKTSTEATPIAKETSGLKRLLEKAQDQDPIGELRQIKNEILAFNFQQREN